LGRGVELAHTLDFVTKHFDAHRHRPTHWEDVYDPPALTELTWDSDRLAVFVAQCFQRFEDAFWRDRIAWANSQEGFLENLDG
jgi:hypothetical protein